MIRRQVDKYLKKQLKLTQIKLNKILICGNGTSFKKERMALLLSRWWSSMTTIVWVRTFESRSLIFYDLFSNALQIFVRENFTGCHKFQFCSNFTHLKNKMLTETYILKFQQLHVVIIIKRVSEWVW